MTMRIKRLLLFFILLLSICSFAQDEFDSDPLITFNSTRVISGHSVEVLPEKTFEMRIENRFGNITGTNGGVQTMFGLDNLTDMRIALEYGLTKKLMFGFGRCKGTGAPYRSLLDGFVKYRLFKQVKDSMPLSCAIIGGATFTYQKASSDISNVNHFPRMAHRFAYFSQLNLARRFGKFLSVSLMPTLVHRNYVADNDINTLLVFGGALRFKLSKKFCLLTEYYHCFNGNEFRQEGYQNSLGVALEWSTFGYNFTINFTNSKGLGEIQFIPYTSANWLDGQFRMGFCLSRQF